jgi:uncharacterized membrane protein
LSIRSERVYFATTATAAIVFTTASTATHHQHVTTAARSYVERSAASKYMIFIDSSRKNLIATSSGDSNIGLEVSESWRSRFDVRSRESSNHFTDTG